MSPPFILSVGHIGTSVPVLLIWLLLDRAPQRWYVPLLTALGLAWVLIADQLVLLVGVLPLALVCALRVAEAAVRERSLSRGVAARRYELSLIAAAGVAVGLAWVAERVLRALGGYVLNPVPFKFNCTHIPDESARPVGRAADLRRRLPRAGRLALLHRAAPHG